LPTDKKQGLAQFNLLSEGKNQHITLPNNEEDRFVGLELDRFALDNNLRLEGYSSFFRNDRNEFGRLTLTLPITMVDGNADYTVTFSAIPLDTNYNIAFIINTSASMNATELQQAKDAYISLVNYFIDNGFADVSNFAVISFSCNATLYANLTANQAISKIKSLTTASPLEETKYNDALSKGRKFFTQSPLQGVTNIAYFTSKSSSQDRYFTYEENAIDLRGIANVQAFGIYDSKDPKTVSQSQLDFVDSDYAVVLSNASQLKEALGRSGLISYLDKVEILVKGNVVKTIQTKQLTDSPLGLTYEGTVDNLDVSLYAKNIVTAKAYFNNGTPPSTLDFTVASGLVKYTSDLDILTNIIVGTNGNDDIFISDIDIGADGGAGDDKIIGNRYDNNLNGGAGDDTILAGDGNDTIFPGNGHNKVDAAAGIDTVVYPDKLFTPNILKKVGKVVVVDYSDNLTNVEYIQFSNVRIDANTLQVVPILK
jgi:Ca2+-binding RTX toxin-like protein